MKNYLKRNARKMTNTKKRCPWSGTDPLYVKYHDKEWGVPVYQDRKLFEFLILEGAQAGLSWLTILKRREGYRAAFDQFDVGKIAGYGKRKINSLLRDPGIIRNKLKVNSAVTNAQAFLKIQDEFGSFSKYQWQFVAGKPIRNKWRSMKQLPAKTALSDAFSKDLKKRGFSFVGSTIIYAHMQAVGMVNDHVVDCWRY
jgi:DNA-3-methyladenine glycosylase I